jgi:hypothetical protein
VNETTPIAFTEYMATRVKPGDVLVITCARRLSDHERDLVAQQCEAAAQSSGVRMIFLDHGMKVEAVQESCALPLVTVSHELEEDNAALGTYLGFKLLRHGKIVVQREGQ